MDDKTSLEIGGRPLWKYFLYITMICIGFAVLGGVVIWIFFKGNEFFARLYLVVAILGLCSLILIDNIIHAESKKTFVRIISYIAVALNVLWAATWCLNVVNVFDGLKSGCTEPPYGLEYENYCFKSKEEFEDFIDSASRYHKCARSYEDAVKTMWIITSISAVFGLLLTALAGILSYENYNSKVKIAKYVALAIAGILALFEFGAISMIQEGHSHYKTETMIILAIIPPACLVVTQMLMMVYKSKQK